MSSPALALPQASGRYDGWLADSILPCHRKNVEGGPHISSYLYTWRRNRNVSHSESNFSAHPRKSSLLPHPYVPRDRPGFLIRDWTVRHLEGQLDLTVMVALVPDHVLEQEDRVVVVKVHVPACLHPALHGVPHCFGAVVEHLGDAVWVTLEHPLFLGKFSGELGGVLGDQYKSHKMDVCEQLRDGWAALHRLGPQPALREGAQQVD